MNLINKHIALVDVSAVCYAAMYACTTKVGSRGLFHEGKPTSVIFDFFSRLRYYQNTLKPDLFVFTCDSKTSKRTELFPEYKVKRNKNKKEDLELKEMLSLTRPQILRLQYKLLPYLGFNNVLCTKGLEADDIQASIIRDNPASIITNVTRDKDLRQTLSSTSRMFDPVTRKLYTVADLKEDLNCTPEEWKKAFGYSGCTTDEIPGIPGVAIKTALKYVHGELKDTTKAHAKITQGWEDPETKEWIAAKDVIDFTKQLVHLPFEGTPSYKLQKNSFDNNKLRKMADHFEFTSMEMTYKEWRFS